MMPDPFDNYRKFIMITALTAIMFLLSFTGRSSEREQYFYPSAAVYGFVGECWKTMEGMNHPISQELWPSEIQTLCGCILDNIRMTVPWIAFRDNWKGELDPIQRTLVMNFQDSCLQNIRETKQYEMKNPNGPELE